MWKYNLTQFLTHPKKWKMNLKNLVNSRSLKSLLFPCWRRRNVVRLVLKVMEIDLGLLTSSFSPLSNLSSSNFMDTVNNLCCVWTNTVNLINSLPLLQNMMQKIQKLSLNVSIIFTLHVFLNGWKEVTHVLCVIRLTFLLLINIRHASYHDIDVVVRQNDTNISSWLLLMQEMIFDPTADG